jgi:hypothetical protein
VLFVAAAACSSPAAEPETEAPVRQSMLPPWTSAFYEPAVLLADVIDVRGPEDLLAHLVVAQNPEVLEYSSRTTTAGLVQEVQVRPGTPGLVEIKAQLDALEMVATRRLVVLQRPGNAPVEIRAAGNAYYARADGSGERRESVIRLVGERGR